MAQRSVISVEAAVWSQPKAFQSPVSLPDESYTHCLVVESVREINTELTRGENEGGMEW